MLSLTKAGGFLRLFSEPLLQGMLVLDLNLSFRANKGDNSAMVSCKVRVRVVDACLVMPMGSILGSRVGCLVGDVK